MKRRTARWFSAKLFVNVSIYKGQTLAVRFKSVINKLCKLGKQNIVLPTNQNQSTASNAHVPKSSKNARTFAECSKNQSKLQKLGSPVLFSNSKNGIALLHYIGLFTVFAAILFSRQNGSK